MGAYTADKPIIMVAAAQTKRALLHVVIGLPVLAATDCGYSLKVSM
jgi:hypothetical protein